MREYSNEEFMKLSEDEMYMVIVRDLAEIARLTGRSAGEVLPTLANEYKKTLTGGNQ
jgi:hypothetical protein